MRKEHRGIRGRPLKSAQRKSAQEIETEKRCAGPDGSAGPAHPYLPQQVRLANALISDSSWVIRASVLWLYCGAGPGTCQKLGR